MLIGDHWTGIERARLVGQNAAILTISLAIFPPVGGLLTELGGWRLSFAPYALGLATAVLIYHRLDANRPAARRHPARAASRRRAPPSAHRDVIGSVSIGFVIFMLIFGLFLTAMPVHLESEFGLSAGQRGLVIAIPAITSTFTALAARPAARHASAVVRAAGRRRGAVHHRVRRDGAGRGAPACSFAAALLYGLGEGVFIPTLQDVVAGASAPEQRGAVVAVWVGAARAGQTVGPLLAAALYGATSTGTTFVVGGVIAAGLVVYELVGPVRRRRPRARRPPTAPGRSSPRPTEHGR